MGVDTKIHIAKTDTVFQMVRNIEKALKKTLPVYGDTDVTHDHIATTGDEFNDYDGYRILFALDYPCDQYESGKEQRMLWAYYDHYKGGEMMYLSLGAWGHNEDIARCLVDNFGGYADYSGCDEIIIDYAQPQPKTKQPI